jgi:hypothetical protein
MSRTCRAHGENKNEYEVLNGEAEVKRPPECPKSRSVIILKINNVEIECGGEKMCVFGRGQSSTAKFSDH